MTTLTRLTREEFEAIIENYEATGKDTTELKKALTEAYPPKPVKKQLVNREALSASALSQRQNEAKEKATQGFGTCAICNKQNITTYAGVCKKCFKSWVASLTENRGA